jgi:transposase
LIRKKGGIMRYIEGVNRKRRISFPEYIDEYITENNAVRVIDAFVDSLNLTDLGFKNAEDINTGRPGYNPADMLKLYLYGYMNRITTSRRLEAEAGRNIELMWLLRKLKPDNRTISEFRRQNKEAIQKVFRQLVTLCKDWDLFGMEVVAVDGSKFRACNSKKNNFNEKSLDRKIKYIDEKLEEYMSELDQNDESEKGSRVPDKEEIKKRVKELRGRKETYQKYQEELKEKGINEISTTDPDARLMAVNNNGVDVCYNVQTVVDNKNKLVVDYNVINNPTDHGQLGEMAGRAKKIFEVDSIKALADKGYYNANDLKACEEEGIITYVAKQVF